MTATGTEGRVCELIAKRQAFGIGKYGTTVSDNQLSLRAWHQNHLEELLDAAIYVQRIIEQIDKESDDGRPDSRSCWR